VIPVIVNAVGAPVLSAAMLAVALKVPLPMLDSVAGPLKTIDPVAPAVPAAVTLSVVVTVVAACAPTLASEANDKTASVRLKSFAILVVFLRVCIVSLRGKSFPSIKRVYKERHLL
jgi:hypothetical protein